MTDFEADQAETNLRRFYDVLIAWDREAGLAAAAQKEDTHG